MKNKSKKPSPLTPDDLAQLHYAMSLGREAQQELIKASRFAFGACHDKTRLEQDRLKIIQDAWDLLDEVVTDD